MRAVCVRCGQIMKPEKTGAYFLEKDGEGRPYNIWSADRFECPKCEALILTGFGLSAVTHRPSEELIQDYRENTVLIEEGEVYD